MFQFQLIYTLFEDLRFLISTRSPYLLFSISFLQTLQLIQRLIKLQKAIKVIIAYRNGTGSDIDGHF